MYVFGADLRLVPENSLKIRVDMGSSVLSLPISGGF